MLETDDKGFKKPPPVIPASQRSQPKDLAEKESSKTKKAEKDFRTCLCGVKESLFAVASILAHARPGLWSCC